MKFKNHKMLFYMEVRFRLMKTYKKRVNKLILAGELLSDSRLISWHSKYEKQLVRLLQLNETNLTNLIQRFSESEAQLTYDNYSTISGGEKQRIAVVRSILTDANVILFDEATSSLDPENAKAIYSILLSLKDIMLIAITHEWSDELTNVYNRRRCYSCC